MSAKKTPHKPPKTEPAASEEHAAKDTASPPKNPYPELPGRVTLDVLATALPRATEKQRALLLRGLDIEGAVAWGIEADSEAILVEAPHYIGEAVNILHRLGARFAIVQLPPSIFHAAVLEAQALVEAKKVYDAKTTSASGATKGKKSDVRQATKQGVALRDKTVSALHNAFGKAQTTALDASVGDASSPANLAKGLRAVAAFLDGELASNDDDTQEALGLWQLTAATSSGLVAAAASLEAMGDAGIGTRRVEQRKLDEQDGHVLYLFSMIDRAFKGARREDSTILLPTFTQLSGLFNSRATAAAPPTPPAPTPPAPPPPAPPPPAPPPTGGAATTTS